jgi:ribosomal protein S18 acetylase RimI-like enzyme
MSAWFVAVATREDLPELVAMVNAAYRGDEARRGWTHEADLLDGQRTDVKSLDDELSAPDPSAILILRAREGAPILACVLLQRIIDDDEIAKGYVVMLTVSPEAQNRGLGRVMLDLAETRARTLDCKALIITVLHLREALIAWYERRGFRRGARTKPFPSGDPRFGLPRRDDLHFIVMEKPL